MGRYVCRNDAALSLLEKRNAKSSKPQANKEFTLRADINAEKRSLYEESFTMVDITQLEVLENFRYVSPL